MACHNFSGIQHAPNKRRRFCAHQAFVVGEVVQNFKRRNRNQFGHFLSIWPHVRSALALVKVAPDKNVIILYFGNAPVRVQWALAGGVQIFTFDYVSKYALITALLNPFKRWRIMARSTPITHRRQTRARRYRPVVQQSQEPPETRVEKIKNSV